MVNVSFGLVQMNCGKGEIEQNLVRIARYVEAARARGVDMLCFPEMSITGYVDPTRWPEAVLSLDDPAVDRLAAMSADSAMTVLAGIVEANPAGKPFITQVVATDGRVQGFYRKINVAEDELSWFARGSETPVFA